MATIEFTYKGRRIWIDPYVAAQGWQAKAEIWEVGKQGLVKDEIRLPANYYFHSLRAARGFVERMTKRGIDRRVDVAHLRRKGNGSVAKFTDYTIY